MNLEKLQTELKAWQAHNFPNRTVVQPLIGIQEELGELSHAILKKLQKIRVGENHDESIIDACADMVVYMCDFCNAINCDLQTEVCKIVVFPQCRSAATQVVHMGGTLGQINSAYLRASESKFQNEDWTLEICEHCAELFAEIDHMLILHNREIFSVLDQVWPEVRSRDWIKFPKNGRTE